MLLTPKALANSNVLTPKAFANGFDRSLMLLTPKAFANFSPGFELARTLGNPQNKSFEP